jgi:beta-glucanase (GH16 family)
VPTHGRRGRAAAVVLLALVLALTSASFSAATLRAAATPQVAGSGAGEAAAPGAVNARKKPPEKHKHKKATKKATKKAPKPCAGQAPTKADGTRWKCTFSDEFTGTKLNRKKWGVVRTSATGYHIGPECLVDRPDVIAVSRGALHLSVRQARPFACTTHGGSDYEAVATAGSVSTMDTFTQAYGLYRIRASFPKARKAGLHSAIWMFPKTISATLLGTDYGEIDIAEYFTSWYDRVIPVLHYNPFPLVPQQYTNQTCVLKHPEQFHTYALEWTTSKIAISIDGRPCLVNDNWTPMPPLSHPAPFDKPFALILTQALGAAGNAPTAATPLPATMHVDWVRVWR